MNKKKIAIITIVVIIAIIVVVGIVIWPRPNLILYYGKTCPHCKLVEDFISQNNITQKISFQNKEVYENQNNALELASKAQKCSLPTDSIGVPFLFDGSNSKCIIGDADIIQFFKDKTGTK